MPTPMRALPVFVLVCSCAAIRPAPVDTRTPLAKAQADLAGGRHDEAAKEFEQILEGDPGSLAALRGRVETSRRRGDLARVANEAAAAAQSRPSHGPAFYALGLVRSAQRDAGAAEAAFTRALELMPAEADVAYRLGLVLLERQKLPEARSSLARSVELAPTAVRYRVVLASCLAKSGDRAAAVGALRELPRLQPTPEETSLAVKAERGILDPFREVPADARQEVENALGYLSGDAPGLALESLEALVGRYPDLAIAHALLALAAERLAGRARRASALKRGAGVAPR